MQEVQPKIGGNGARRKYWTGGSSRMLRQEESYAKERLSREHDSHCVEGKIQVKCSARVCHWPTVSHVSS